LKWLRFRGAPDLKPSALTSPCPRPFALTVLYGIPGIPAW
jgi:hypothetical protein